MEIELKRAFAPDEIGREEECGVCEVWFTTGTVSAHVLVHDLGVVCPSCVEYLGKRNPSAFPTIEEYEEANGRYTEPVYASVAEVLRLEESGDPSLHDAYWASWFTRGCPGEATATAGGER